MHETVGKNMTKNFWKSNFKTLTQGEKLVFLGSFLNLISVFLPWYSDLDRFGTGDVFLGITGPLYLAGILVLLVNLSSFVTVFLKFLRKSNFNLPIEDRVLFIVSGIITCSILLLSLSVFFHEKFGLNVIEKSLGVGVILGFIGGFLVFLGGILQSKKENYIQVIK